MKREVDQVGNAPTDVLEWTKELHDIRDHVTNLKAREKELVEAIRGHYEEYIIGLSEGDGINIGYASISLRRGRETVDIPILRDKLGEDAEEFVTHYKPALVIAYIDAVSIERELKVRSE